MPKKKAEPTKPIDFEPFEKTHPYLKELPAFLDSLNKESERGAVLIAGAMLDDALALAIQRRLVDHKDTKKLTDGFNAPLGTFSARILGAFSLGIISEAEYAEMETLRKVRNKFAHGVTASFKDQQLKDLCQNLKGCVPGLDTDARARYTTSILPMIIATLNRANWGAGERLTFKRPHNETYGPPKKRSNS
jgi:mannitol operon repressor